MGRHPVVEGGNFGSRQAQAELRSPPYHVIGGSGPFVAPSGTRLRFPSSRRQRTGRDRPAIWRFRAILSRGCRRHAPAGWHGRWPGTDNSAISSAVSAATAETSMLPPGSGDLPVQPSLALALRKYGDKPFQRFFGEAAIGGDLAAIDRQQRHAAGGLEFEHIIAGGGLGFAGAVIIERTNAGIGPDHILGLHRHGPDIR